jgi:hypothetical protein
VNPLWELAAAEAGSWTVAGPAIARKASWGRRAHAMARRHDIALSAPIEAQLVRRLRIQFALSSAIFLPTMVLFEGTEVVRDPDATPVHRAVYIWTFVVLPLVSTVLYLFIALPRWARNVRGQRLAHYRTVPIRQICTETEWMTIGFGLVLAAAAAAARTAPGRQPSLVAPVARTSRYRRTSLAVVNPRRARTIVSSDHHPGTRLGRSTAIRGRTPDHHRGRVLASPMPLRSRSRPRHPYPHQCTALAPIRSRRRAPGARIQTRTRPLAHSLGYPPARHRHIAKPGRLPGLFTPVEADLPMTAHPSQSAYA